MPEAQRQTIKQAKAAFKARGRPALSDAEQKQLERSLELDRRAWRSKEQEKRKAEAVRKREDKERKDREARQQAMLGTQRRCDRFGYKSSQFHLGAFFGSEAPKQLQTTLESVPSEDEFFDDSDVDDQTLLDALEITGQHPLSDGIMPSVPLRSGVCTQRPTAVPSPTVEVDLSDFWEELGSGTQIARELEAQPDAGLVSDSNMRATSFNSGDFDLTMEDMEDLESSIPAVSKVEQDRKLMPAPALPLKALNAPTVEAKAPDHSPAPVRPYHSNDSVTQRPPYAGFTMTELETFVDDDLQLTQAAP